MGKEEEKQVIKDVITYQFESELFLDRMRADQATTALLAESWLYDIDESTLSEAERLNVILPVIKWCAEHGVMTEWFRNELWLYYESYLNGTLDEDYKDYVGEDDEGVNLEEDKATVFRDLKATYKLVYGTEELVDEL